MAHCVMYLFRIIYRRHGKLPVPCSLFPAPCSLLPVLCDVSVVLDFLSINTGQSKGGDGVIEDGGQVEQLPVEAEAEAKNAD